MRWLSLIIATCLATPIAANPWLRDEGSSFLSLEDTSRYSESGTLQDRYSSVFFEYGLSRDTTLIFHAGIDRSDNIDAVVSLKRSLFATEGGPRASYELGIGQRDVSGQARAFVRAGAAIGSGISFGARSGWVSLMGYHDFQDVGSTSKVEATLGLNGTGGWKYILQATADKLDGRDWQGRLAPSIAIPLSAETHLLVGLYTESRAPADIGLKVGVWQEF
ncbi:hypothetical protein N6L24_07600 [Cognatishimia sp. SS12]|uniref:hypothetical protein n=1 Tax=Cognatishimia sp. SS12 TaxID=2979465 RepID=UPI00232F9F51|nr:hypothetical protein [Cognatishimia sp. SS12]MDC0738139.1 hypothetical protein [Cognatishimia sp. SS12]